MQCADKTRTKEIQSAMNEKEEKIHSQADHQDAAAPPSPDVASQRESGSRRELIARYGKYVIVAAPLLMFVSKARAIHSKP
jgi:hypothetical protein